MKKHALSLPFFLLIFLLSGCQPSTHPFPSFDTQAQYERFQFLESMGGYYLPGSDFIYIDLLVPLDHTDPDNGQTTEVVFAVLPASGNRVGMFIVANGGPGVSGLAVADNYITYYDPIITESFDIVFFDQRGVGLSGNLQCPQAAVAFYMSEWADSTPEKELLFLQAAEQFVHDCVAEMGDPDILPYLGTTQAVEDLEFFRHFMGEEQFWLYGESYGTQFAQTYAALYPERLAGMILDGPVDLTLSGIEYLEEQATTFYEVLITTLEAGNSDEYCAADMDTDALDLYADLVSLLKGKPLVFDFPLSDGKTATRSFTYNDLETVVATSLYSEGSRMLLLRALAYYVRDGNPVMLARMLYNALSVDPETLAPISDPSFSDAIYYAVQAQDYSYFDGTPAERAEAYLRAGDPVEDRLPYMASVFYGDLPVVFWPTEPTTNTRPEPLVAENIPTLVLGSTADPATPYSNALSVHSRLDDGYLVTQVDGPHVIFGWGNYCVDDLVTAFLVNGIKPAKRETTCSGPLIEEYVPIAPRKAEEFSDPLEALASVDDEIYYLPEYYYWDLITPVAVGCPYGGTLIFAPSAEGEKFTFDSCSFSRGFIITGTGSYSYDEDLFELEVELTGIAEGVLTYRRNYLGRLSVTGVYNGKDINLTY